MNEIVKYHNDLSSQITIKTLNANEYNIFMAICSQMKERGTEEAVFTFQQLKELTNWNNNNNDLFVRSIINTNKKLISLHFTFRYDQTTVQFVLFPTFRTDRKNQTLTVKVNDEFSFLLNNLSSNFTRFELENFTSLQSKYSKYLYKELMKFKSTGYKIFEVNDFREKMDIPIKYRMSEIDKFVFTPIKLELPKIFSKFEIKKIKKGREIKHIEFHFSLKKEKRTEEPIEQEVIDAEIIEIKPIDEIKEFWIHSFPGVNFTKKHSEKLEKLLQKNSVSYVKNYLKEQWEYVKHSELVKNKEAYFSSLILEEKAVLKDYIPNEHKELKKEETMRLFEEPKEEKIKIKNLTEDDYIQTALFTENTETEPHKEEKKIITKEEYEKRYFEYLDRKEDSKIQRSIFALAMRKKGYQVEEKKVYTIEDIPEEQLLSKNGKKLVGSALQMRVDKILKEMNEGEE